MFINLDTNYSNINKNDLYLKKIIDEATKISSDILSSSSNRIWYNDTWWLDILANSDLSNLDEISKEAERLRSISDVVVVVWVWWSYLWSKAIIDALSDQFGELNSTEVIFWWINMDPDYINSLIKYLEWKSFSLLVISKSWSTTEPSLSFKILREILLKKYWSWYNNYITTITDKNKSILRDESIAEKYNILYLPERVWWRYSVLTSVWLLPIAIAWYDIYSLFKWASDILNEIKAWRLNDHIYYSSLRQFYYNSWKKVEIFVSYKESLRFFLEWVKQLFWESEWKDWKWLFPSSAIFTTDLHSIWQYIQDWERIIFETVLNINKLNTDIIVEKSNINIDDWLSYLEGKSLSYINSKALIAASKAHSKNDAPNIILNISDLNEYNLWQLILFFELSCAISSYLLWVNPFNQPWVEEYKNNMYKLLWKN